MKHHTAFALTCLLFAVLVNSCGGRTLEQEEKSVRIQQQRVEDSANIAERNSVLKTLQIKEHDVFIRHMGSGRGRTSAMIHIDQECSKCSQ